MAGVSSEKMKKVGRNMARADLQRGASQPRLNTAAGRGDGGVIGRYKGKVHTSVKGGK